MTGYVNEILGDDRLWDTGWPETALTGWPLEYEIANLAILNRTTDKKLIIRTLNTRPFTGPCGTFPTIRIGRITGYTGGETNSPISFDSENATPALEVKYRPSSVTEVANTYSMVQWVNTGMNLTRANQWSRWQGCSKCGFDQTEVGRWTDSDTQKITLREGEGIGLFFKTDSGPNIFMISAFVKGSGGTFLYNDIVEPLYMAGACFMVLYNPVGSGDVFYIARIQAREVGSDELPGYRFFKICTILGQPQAAQVVWADSNDEVPTDIQVSKNCLVRRHGLNNGAIITAPLMRRIVGGESPYGPNTANGGSIARRGLWSHDMRFQNSNNVLKLGPGEGIAVVMQNPATTGYCELISNFAVEQIVVGTFPSEGNVRDGTVYGPGGSDYTGNMELPSANDTRVAVSYGTNGTELTGTIALPAVGDVKLGVSYGANGTEATGTLAGGSGGGNRIFYPSGISGG